MQLANISLLRSDGITSTSFTPLNNQNYLTSLQEDDLNKSVDVRETLSVKLRPGSNTTKRKVTQKVQVPYRPAAIDGVTQAIKTIETIVVFNVPLDASPALIQDCAALTTAAIANAIVEDIYVNGRAPV